MQDIEAQASPNSLSESEAIQLAAEEAVIERGLTTFCEVGEALERIRAERLYRATHARFEDYCKERWGFSDSRARQLILAAQTVTDVTVAGLPAPANEAQARRMRRLIRTGKPEPEVQNGKVSTRVTMDADLFKAIKGVGQAHGISTNEAIVDGVRLRLEVERRQLLKQENTVTDIAA